MKTYIKSELVRLGYRVDEDEFVDQLLGLGRIPDAVAVIDELKAVSLGFRSCITVLFIECEHSAPLTEKALFEYTDLWMDADDMGSDIQVGVAVVERYGRWQLLDLSALCFARHIRNHLDFDRAFDQRKQDVARMSTEGGAGLYRLRK